MSDRLRTTARSARDRKSRPLANLIFVTHSRIDRHPLLSAASIGAVGIAVTATNPTFTAPPTSTPKAWHLALYVVSLLLFAAAIALLSVAWDRGRVERRRRRSVEQFVARLGHTIWTLGTTLGTIGMVGTYLSGESRVSLVFAAIGMIWLWISGVMGGTPSVKKGLEPLSLNKRIMAWQIGVSTATAVPLLGKTVGSSADLFESVGTNWGYPGIISIIWLLSAGIGTMLYEPLKFRLESTPSPPSAAPRSNSQVLPNRSLRKRPRG